MGVADEPPSFPVQYSFAYVAGLEFFPVFPLLSVGLSYTGSMAFANDPTELRGNGFRVGVNFYVL